MRRASEEIVRERHPTPIVEELFHDLNGSTVFSKVDLKWSFHQVLLSEDSLHVTTFVTHYKVGCRTRIIADASPVGLGSVLAEIQGDLRRVIAYVS